MGFYRIFDNKEDLLRDLGGEKATNERVAELALFRERRTNDMVKKQKEVINQILSDAPIDEKTMKRAKAKLALREDYHVVDEKAIERILREMKLL